MVLECLLALSLRFFLFDFILFKKLRIYLKQKGYFFRKLLSCPFCQGFWCGLGVYLCNNTIGQTFEQIITLFSFGFVCAWLGLISAVVLHPLIKIYERDADMPLQ